MPASTEASPSSSSRAGLPGGRRGPDSARGEGEYAYSKTFAAATHAVVKGELKYYEIQFGHRVYSVKAGDVVLERVS